MGVYKFTDMKTNSLITIFLIVASCFGLAAQDKELTLNEKIAINNLKDHVAYKRKEAVAKQVAFPLERCSYFGYIIHDQKEFISSFDTIFDSKQIEEFQKSKWEYIFTPVYEYYYLHGSGYLGGFSDEGILYLTYIQLSETEQQYIKELIEKEKQTLHISLRNYMEPVCTILAGKYRIRIDRMPDNELRYASWKKDAEISAAPDLVILGGKTWGNRWGTNYDFKNGEYEYSLSDYICADEGPYFMVSKNNQTILEIKSDDVKIIEF